MIKHPKRRGEWVELQFMTRATHQGLTVSKPWGDSARYDFIVEHKGHCARVQVKSTFFYRRGAYQCKFFTGCGGYSKRDIELVVAYVIPEEIWYVIPIAEVEGYRGITLEPRRPTSKYFRYMEAWHLLRGASAKKRLPKPSRDRGATGPVRSNL